MNESPGKGRTHGNAQCRERLELAVAGWVPPGPSHCAAKCFSLTVVLGSRRGKKSLSGDNSVPGEGPGAHRVGVLQRSDSRHLTSSFGIKELIRSLAAVAVAVPLPTGSRGGFGAHRVGVRDSPAAQGASDRRERATEQPGTWVRCGAVAVCILPTAEANPDTPNCGVSGGEASI